MTTIATLLAAFGAGYVLARLIGPFPRFALFETSDRRHLDEIPIDRSDACGKVETIHTALDTLNTSYTAATFGLDATQWDSALNGVVPGTGPSQAPSLHQSPWPSVEARVDASAAQLDLVLADGIPHFPPRLRHELAVVRESIAEGRAQLPKVDDVTTFGPLTRRYFDRGQLHAGYASDLVGNQCPVPLGA